MMLSLRVRPVGEEPSHGVLMRLAARHRAESLIGYATACGVRLNDVLRGHHVRVVEDLAGFPEGSVGVNTAAIDHQSRQVTLRGNILLLGDWSIKRRRWCPRCLLDDRAKAAMIGLPASVVASHRYWWDVRSIFSCPFHRVP